MTDFLLELRSEEIPARMQDKAREDLARLFSAELDKAGLKAGELVTYATPRRLALIARDLPAQTEAVSEELKGPPADAPDAAIDGFLRKAGLTRDALETRDVKGRATLFAVIDKPGQATAEVLATAIPAIVRAFPWPKSMRWGAASQSTESLRWVRPLQGIVALFGDDVVECEVAGVRSGAATVGHRFHHPGVITIGSASDYVEKLRACHVIVDQNERRATIALGAKMAANKAGLTLIEDEGLLIENAGLTEWPVPLLGRFDEAFLDVPPEVIQLTARVNQKYFVCQDAAGKLANAFVCTANIDAADGGAKIVEGNQKVLAARLSDARFFYETDARIPLAEHANKLEKIVFHEKLGSVLDRCDRFGRLMGQMISSSSEDAAEKINSSITLARVSKADLVTGMVGEFPELQGVMGGYYAAADGYPETLQSAVRQHYQPQGPDDLVPTGPIAYSLALADKLDSVSAFFAVGQKPTGSKDPFALRRAALGICRIILERGVRARLQPVIALAISNLVVQNVDKLIAFIENECSEVVDAKTELVFDTDEVKIKFKGLVLDVPVQLRAPLEIAHRLGASEAQANVVAEVFAFIVDRLKVQQREAGVRHDLIDAVFALGGEDDLVRLLARVHALQAFMATDDGANLLAGYKRAANILKKEGVTDAVWSAPAYAPEPAEAALIAALDGAEPKAAAAVEGERFEEAMAALATLRAPIDAFFTDVTVNDADPAKRESRLALLARMRDAVHRVADFGKIEG
ncbi:glycine--tRNA ligase subunit beta [Sphingomonas koreensis]|uniref:Glycine--tRNA ligase beta subunit n=1 Tax=Sphingomonas koreensis TaxID=93064 RepID=A0A430FZQ8_9SPHN|nr:glycine--tRNA ligase subunit beta [Sphingomonas koreensis]RSY78816.1 glycine--tRNA ligase subunit beta [Sphingomonas koreensis]